VYSRFEVAVSPNGKWLAIWDSLESMVNVLSLFYGVQVWQTRLDDGISGTTNFFSSITFDALSTKVVVNCSNIVYVFVLPCLIEQYKVDFKGIDRRMDFKNDLDLARDVISVIK